MRGAIESLGDNDLIIDFLRHVCNLLYGQTRERDVFVKIKTGNKGSGDAVSLLALLGDNDLIIDFLRHVCNLLYGQTRERDVFVKIKTGNKGSGDAVSLLALLGELAQDYAAILNPDHPKWNT